MRPRTIIKNHNGAAVVEFALLVPFLFLLIFGIIEFALILFNQQVITNAAREGARLGVIVRLPRVSDQEIKDEVKSYAQKYLVSFGSNTLDDSDIEILPTGRCLGFGCDLEVSVTYDYNFLVLPELPIELKSVSVMRME